MTPAIKIQKGKSNRYNSVFVLKIKSIKGQRWYPVDADIILKKKSPDDPRRKG